jgi:hypothetical protein
MPWDQLAALASFGQLVVVAAAASFAYLQLLGLRRQHEAQIVQHIFDELNAPDFGAALDFVYNRLPEKLNDPSYVREIREGRATVSSHPELIVMHFFNELGLLVHGKLVSDLIVPFVASPCMRSWDRLAPVVELMRRRYPHAYTPFEALVARARALDLSAINARFRSETPCLRSEWERTARDLIEGRITLLDEPAEKPETGTQADAAQAQ